MLSKYQISELRKQVKQRRQETQIADLKRTIKEKEDYLKPFILEKERKDLINQAEDLISKCRVELLRLENFPNETERKKLEEVILQSKILIQSNSNSIVLKEKKPKVVVTQSEDYEIWNFR